MCLYCCSLSVQIESKKTSVEEPLLTLADLKADTVLPPTGWIYQSPDSEDYVQLIKFQVQSSSSSLPMIRHCLTVEKDFTWKLFVHGHGVTAAKCSLLAKIPTHLKSDALHVLLCLVDQLRVCPGHPDQHFQHLTEAKKGKLTNSSGEITAYIDKTASVVLNGQSYSRTVRSSQCHILTSSIKCPDCVSYRDSIRSMYHRWQTRINASPSRSQSSSHCHVNDKWLNTPQRKAKLSKLQHRTKLADTKIKYLQKKIAASIEKRGVDVDDSLQTGLEKIIAEQTNIVRKQYAVGSFHHLFWDQQIEAMS